MRRAGTRQAVTPTWAIYRVERDDSLNWLFAVMIGGYGSQILPGRTTKDTDALVLAAMIAAAELAYAWYSGRREAAARQASAATG